MSNYELTDYQWSQISDLFPPKTSKCGRARRDPRELVNAILWVLRTGSPWCALPKKYGPWHTAYNNFRKWTDDCVIAKIFERFSPNADETTELQIDGTYIKAHQHIGVAKKGALWGRLSLIQEAD